MSPYLKFFHHRCRIISEHSNATRATHIKHWHSNENHACVCVFLCGLFRKGEPVSLFPLRKKCHTCLVCRHVWRLNGLGSVWLGFHIGHVVKTTSSRKSAIDLSSRLPCDISHDSRQTLKDPLWLHSAWDESILCRGPPINHSGATDTSYTAFVCSINNKPVATRLSTYLFLLRSADTGWAANKKT